MRLTFRQGVVSYPQSGNVQQFLQTNGSYVDLSTTNGPTSVTIAHRDTNYFVSEGEDVVQAWGPIPATPVWLYIDIDRATGARTFGFTNIKPVSGDTAPSSPVNGQHWFNTSTFIHFVRQSNQWVEVVRVFVARYDGPSTFAPLGNNPRLPFAGTQISVEGVTSFAGTILFDESGEPVVKSSNGTFYTTETEFFQGATRINGIRLESDVIAAVLNQNTAAYHVVKFNQLGRLELANYNDSENAAVAITTQSGLTNDLINVVAQGIVTNEQWNWPNVGEALFINQNGELSANDPHITNPSLFPQPRVPVARVVGRRRIIFQQGLGGVGPRGPAGDITNLPFASGVTIDGDLPAPDPTLGAVFLDVDPDISTVPIAIGANSPIFDDFLSESHLTDADAHDAENITYNPTGSRLTSTDVQAALVELDGFIEVAEAGLDPKESVRVATTGPFTAAYNPAGGTGTGAFTSGAPTSVDGVVLAINDRVLVKDQADPLQNGIYRVVNPGTGAWVRSADQDGSPASEVSGGNFTFVENGATNVSTGWVVVGNGELTLNTDAINWTQFSGEFYTAATLDFTPATGTGFGTPANLAQLSSTNVQDAAEELLNQKAQKAPRYNALVDLPAANTVSGMYAYVSGTNTHYVSDGTTWVALVRADNSLAYDMTFFAGGPTLAGGTISGAYIATRVITVAENAPGSFAFANTAPAANTTYDLVQIPVGGGGGTTVGTVTFTAGLNVGAVAVPATFTLNPGEQLHLVSPTPVEPNIEDITLTVVGCASLDICVPA